MSINDKTTKLKSLFFNNFIFNLFIYFNRRIILLQYCDSLCCILVSPPSGTPHPLPAIHPGSRRALAWVPCVTHQTPSGYHFTYGKVCVSMRFSQIIPLSPSSTESKHLFSMTVSIAALHTGSSVLSF